MLKRILVGLVAGVLVFLGYVAFVKPAEFHIERSSIIVAPPSAVFAEVNSFRNWQAWSPWAKLDPNAKTTFEGPETGQGAAFQWAGNDQIGEGRMTLIESKPDERIRIRIDFAKPFEGTNEAQFTFRPDGPRTIVTWTMTGEQSFLQKVISVFVNVDALVGAEFEKGLANLKAVAEAKLG